MVVRVSVPGLPIGGIVANIADNDNVGLVRSLPAASVIGTGTDDNLVGSAGDDVINARNGNNRVDGGAGNDVLLAGNDADYITGGAGFAPDFEWCQVRIIWMVG
ncbi:hypothetical protein [[Phormidium] sp. ETS-05]|uniref:hypothetical protein n=1 Tax=[Phormidium] sp. ETS-05 TaxID=222819 RepID=UPI0018EF298C|nr:hypothetical protein [[Phormidium] sp. ETS-05]